MPTDRSDRILERLVVIVKALRNSEWGVTPKQLQGYTGLSSTQIKRALERYKEKYAQQFGEIITYSQAHNVYKLAADPDEACTYLLKHIVVYRVQMIHDQFSIVEVSLQKWGPTIKAELAKVYLKNASSAIDGLIGVLREE